MDISDVLKDADAVLDAFYPGQFGATAIAGKGVQSLARFLAGVLLQSTTDSCLPVYDKCSCELNRVETLFGEVNPSGKLPYTYYKAGYTDHISMNDFSCAKPPGRGYRYLPADSEHILLPAFHGMSYTSFKVRVATAPLVLRNQPATNSLELEVSVANTGSLAGSETILAFFRPQNRTNPGGMELLPLQRRLCGLAKTEILPAKGMVTVRVSITVDSLAMADATGALVSMPGKYSIIISTGTKGAEEINIPLTIQGERLVMEELPPGI